MGLLLQQEVRAAGHAAVEVCIHGTRVRLLLTDVLGRT